jgi:hypothetical protein
MFVPDCWTRYPVVLVATADEGIGDTLGAEELPSIKTGTPENE